MCGGRLLLLANKDVRSSTRFIARFILFSFRFFVSHLRAQVYSMLVYSKEIHTRTRYKSVNFIIKIVNHDASPILCTTRYVSLLSNIRYEVGPKKVRCSLPSGRESEPAVGGNHEHYIYFRSNCVINDFDPQTIDRRINDIELQFFSFVALVSTVWTINRLWPNSIGNMVAAISRCSRVGSTSWAGSGRVT